MKKAFKLRKTCINVLVASMALTAVSSAQACKWYDAPCKARDAYNKTQAALQATANAAKAEADRVAAAAAAQAAATKAEADRVAAVAAAQAAAAKAEADRVAAAAKAAADAAAAAANKLAAAGATISSSELNALKSQANSTYSASRAGVVSGVNASVNTLKSVYNAALDAIWRKAAKDALAKNSAFLVNMKHRAQSLDATGKAALNRVKRAIAAKNVDEQARADMQLLTNAIVYGGNNIGSAVTHSSFGIQYCESAGAGYVGGGACYMMIMQTYLEDGKFKVGLAQSIGVAASPVPSDLGADITTGLFWGPGGISDNNGPSIGIDLGIVLEEGLEVGVSWGIPTTIPDPSAIVPGLSVSIGGGAKGEAAMTAGYTQVITKL